MFVVAHWNKKTITEKTCRQPFCRSRENVPSQCRTEAASSVWPLEWTDSGANIEPISAVPENYILAILAILYIAILAYYCAVPILYYKYIGTYYLNLYLF